MRFGENCKDCKHTKAKFLRCKFLISILIDSETVATNTSLQCCNKFTKIRYVSLNP